MTTTPKRRWFRFRLRTLLILVMVFAVGFGIVTKRAVDQRKAVEVVRKYGGEIGYRHYFTTRGRDPLAERWAPRWLCELLGEHYFVTVVEVELGNWAHLKKRGGEPIENIRPDEIALVINLPALKKLQLADVPITDAMLKDIGRLKNLEWLGLEGSKITDAGLSHLSGLPQLKNLVLGSVNAEPRVRSTTAITDAGLLHLKNLKILELLSLNGTCVTDKGLSEIVSLPELWGLFLAETRVTDAGLVSLQRAQKLTDVSLQNTAITDEGLRALSCLPNLYGLNLSNTRITDQGLSHLAAAPKLMKLLLRS